MSKFYRVLSDDWLPMQFKSSNEIPVSQRMINRETVKDIVKQVEQAVLAKLAEQEPVMYARTYYGEIDWDEACVTEKNDGALMHATDMRKEDFIRHGYAVIPLYAHPMPCVSNTSGKTACVSESGESDTQTNNQGLLDSSNHIADMRKMVFDQDAALTLAERMLSIEITEHLADELIQFARKLYEKYTKTDHVTDFEQMTPEEWRPINTHPNKQLKELLLFNKNKVQLGLLWGDEWVDVAYNRINPQPTHWLPLPNPPKEGEN